MIGRYDDQTVVVHTELSQAIQKRRDASDAAPRLAPIRFTVVPKHTFELAVCVDHDRQVGNSDVDELVEAIVGGDRHPAREIVEHRRSVDRVVPALG